MVTRIVEVMQVGHLLDYGAGSNMSLKETLTPQIEGFVYQAYDPGVPELSDDPEPAEMVCCIDVLEHIEPDCLDDVLDHLAELTEVILFATVHTGPAGKTLPDGRNAHLIQEEMPFWLPLFWERWEIHSVTRRPNGFEVIANA